MLKLVHVAKYGSRGQIPTTFIPSPPPDIRKLEISTNADFLNWVIARFAAKNHIPGYSSYKNSGIPSFIATNRFHLLILHLPQLYFHPSTEYDTCMKNFQDVLAPNELENGPLWCDEGAYRIAKELQLLNPNGFGNIFLGLGEFHLEKIVIACIEKFLEESGVESVFVENEIFGPRVVKTVMNGGHYVRGKRGMG